MPATETTALLNGSSRRSGIVAFIDAEGLPPWLASLKWFLFSSYFNILLIFVPLAVLAHHLQWDVALRFVFSFIAIMPLAKVSATSACLLFCGLTGFLLASR
jgi:Ca2+:H+ antiporter